MTIQTRALNAFFACALISTGCGGGTAGAVGSGGTGGSVIPEGAQLNYEGGPLVLVDTANVCNVVTDGSQTTLSAGVQTREGEANQAALFFLVDEDDVYPGRTVFDSLATGGGSLSDVPMFLNGQFDLLDFDDDIVQQLQLGTCSVDVSFIDTIELFPGTNGNQYAIAFDCATVPYTLLNIVSSTVTEMGALTDLSGQFECILTAAEE